MNRKADDGTVPMAAPVTVSSAPAAGTTSPDLASGVHVIAYGPEKLEEPVLASVEELGSLAGKFPVVWVNIDGPPDATLINCIGKIFDLHPLALEDVINARQRSKVEDYGKYLFAVTRMPVVGDRFDTEQLSLFFGSNFVVTFQECPGGDCFEAVRQRLRKGLGNVRRGGPDHLAYELIDHVVDSYFPLLESMEKRLDRLEEQILRYSDATTPVSIHEIKRDLLTVRHTLRPLRESVTFLMREGSPLVSKETCVYLRDCSDHVVRMLEQIETDAILCSDLMNVHLTSVNNRMSEVMKVLTIITTLFIPPTLIAGIYGMNFNPDKSPWNMPELNWFFGYPFSLVLMGLVVGGLLFFLHHKGWLADLFRRRSR